MLAKAIRIASTAFENTKDKGGKPYILHCLRVMNNLNSQDDELNSIAVLHDYIEDCGEDDPESLYIQLRSEGFSERVLYALRLLTHLKNIPYDDYVKNLAYCEDARRVKLADLKDNSDITRLKGLTKKDFDKMEKYHRSFIYLSKV